MFHHDIAGFHCRMLYCNCNIIRTARLQRSLVQKINCINRGFDCCRMRIEYYCISSSQHTHCIAENRFTWVRTRCDRTNYSKRSHLDQSKTSVSRPCCCSNIFRTRSLVSYKMVFQDLISNISHSGFFHTHAGQNFCILFDFFTNTGDDLLSLIHGHSLYDEF